MRKRGARVLGPYPEPNGTWRVITVGPDGTRLNTILADEAEARAVAEAGRSTAESLGRSVGAALQEYERHLVAKGNRTSSITTTFHRLHKFFADPSLPLADLTRPRCEAYYRGLVGAQAVDTHRNTLAESKSFLRWCVKRRWLRRNPLEGMDGEGARKQGKAQLRIDEARSWVEVAEGLVAAGEPGALAAMLALYMDFRAGEIVALRCRDVDDEGRVVWVERGKTRRARRALRVPDELGTFRDALIRQVGGRPGTDLLFPAERGDSGMHWRDWPREWTQRICAMSGVPRVTAHGLRGTHTTFAMDFGESARAVALSIGHDPEGKTMERHYSTPEAVASGKAKRAIGVLKRPRNDAIGDRSEPRKPESPGSGNPGLSDA